MISKLTPKFRALAPLLALIAAACASEPTSYYTLLPSGGTLAAAETSYQIEVLPVDVPAQVDVPQMVVRTGAGEVTPVDTRRWIAPLPAELRSALSWQLTHELGVRDAYGFPKSVTLPIYRVRVRVQRFDSAPGAYARIDALWSARSGGEDAAAPVCNSSASVSVAPGYAALAEGHQKALAQIAADIATSIRAARSTNAAPTCVAKAG